MQRWKQSARAPALRPAGQAQQQSGRGILQGHSGAGGCAGADPPAPAGCRSWAGPDRNRGAVCQCQRLRTLWQNGGADAAAPYVPAEVLPLYREAFAAGQYTDLAAAQRYQLALLRSRRAGTAPFAQVRGISEGLEHRLEAAVRSSTTHAELLDSLTTVRYPRARMRRLAMDAALDYSADAFPALPPYLHLLGAQKDALPLLKLPHCRCPTPLRGWPSRTPPAGRWWTLSCGPVDFGALCRKKPEPMGGALLKKLSF